MVYSPTWSSENKERFARLLPEVWELVSADGDQKSQDKFGDIFGVSGSTVQSWLRGSIPETPKLEKMAAILSWSLDDLVYYLRTGDRPSDKSEMARQRLSNLIKRARGHLSQRQFAKQLGVSFAAIRSWEKCESMPGTKNLEAIANLTGQNLEELLEYLKGDSPLEKRRNASKAEDLLVPLNALSREELARLIEMAAARLVKMNRESDR